MYSKVLKKTYFMTIIIIQFLFDKITLESSQAL